ncbi:MAG: hypothetical protein LBD88_02570 [Candidatus Peribacteria bacterium]|jgi:hypothetical protein|nr:hypothetical protein [Candidatus Peribacteria bacterium]
MLTKSRNSAAKTEFLNSAVVQSDIANIIEQAQLVIENRSGIGKESDMLDEAISNLINAESKEDVIHCYQELKQRLKLLR